MTVFTVFFPSAYLFSLFGLVHNGQVVCLVGNSPCRLWVADLRSSGWKYVC